MSDYPTPVWWVDACHCFVDVVPRGTAAGDGTVTDELALILMGDSSYAIEGSRAELLALLDRVKVALTQAGVEPGLMRCVGCGAVGRVPGFVHNVNCPRTKLVAT